MTLHVRDTTWTPAKALHLRDAGVWKPAQQGLIKDAGVWKPFFVAGPEVIGAQAIGIFEPNWNTWSGSLTVPSGTTCLVIAASAVGSGAPSVNSVTFNSAALIEDVETTGGQSASLHRLMNPLVGSAATLAMTFSAFVDRHLGVTAIFLKNVNGVDVVGSTVTTTGGTISVSVTPSASDLVIGAALNASGTVADASFSAGVTVDHHANGIANGTWRTHAVGHIKRSPGVYTMSYAKAGMTVARLAVAAFK